MWIVFAVVVILFLLSKIGENAEVQNLKYVEIIKTTDLYKTGYEHSGFSIGRSGTRSYYRRRKRYVGTDIKFRVTYNTGKTATITAREGTKKCQILFDFIDEQDRAKAKQAAYAQTPPSGSKKKAKKDSATEAKEQLIATFSAVAEGKKEAGLSVSETKTAPAKATPAAQQKVYAAGEYKVGVTIPAGEYVLYSTNKDGSYYEVRKGQDIVFNGFAQGALLLELQNGEYFEFDDATVQPAEKVDLVGLNLSSCALKVGTHIPPGEYLLTSLNKDANPVAVYSSCRLIMDKNLKTFEYVEGQKFMSLQMGDVIIYENCKIELVEEHPEGTDSTNEKNAPAEKQYPADCYTVDEDIPHGEYVVFSEEGYEASIGVTQPHQKKERLSFSFVGSCILKLSQGEKFRLQNGHAVPFDSMPEILNRSRSYMLKVGTHIEAGTYQLKQVDTNRFAVYYILNDSTLQFDDAMDSDAVFGATTITVCDGQYIYLENAKLEK